MTEAEIELSCADLGPAIEAFIQIGLRLDTIFPADDPRSATLSGHGVAIRLVRTPSSEPRPLGWVEGRAGMQYRDLIADRLAGRCIASHIRIPDGGPVPDYVHYHEVEFQLIYCHRGWVRVVYEGQGPAFVLEPGDCVLQPPGIRHRVLESSAGLEVIEISSPAEHVTRIDHELGLPTATLDPTRVWSGQRFVRHQSSRATWQPSDAPGFVYRDLSIPGARVIRSAGGQTRRLPNDVDVVGYVLRGQVGLGAGEVVHADEVVVSRRGAARQWIDPSSDFEVLEVELPDHAS